MYTRKKCETHDRELINEFLEETYQNFDEKVNWLIDRFNFTYAVSRIMNGVSEQEYRNRIKLYYKGDVLEAVLLTEGENRGEAFIEMRNMPIEDELLNMILEDVVSLGERLETDIHLRVPSIYTKLIEEVEDRGYEKLEWSEITSKLILNESLDDTLPNGFTFETSEPDIMGTCHSKAFGYADKPIYVDRINEALVILKNSTRYDESLDISVVTDKGVGAAFATMWYDSKNQIGILEPVGTHPDYRKLGLAKSAIYRGCNEILKRGAKAVYVGSDQEFYKKIGFNYASEDKVYKISIK